MDDIKDKLGELFRTTFEEHHAPLESEDWEGLNTKLQRRNFFKFNALQFNVYYASMIIFCFMVCAGIGSHYTYTTFLRTDDNITKKEHSKQELLVSDIENNSGTTVLIKEKDALNNRRPLSSIPKNEGIYSKGNKNTEASNDTSLIPKGSIEKKVKEIENQRIPPEVSPTISIHHHVNSDSLKPKQKTKRTLYITKQDTIIQYDTIPSAKKKKKWLK
jgi:hypothetical protein